MTKKKSAKKRKKKKQRYRVVYTHTVRSYVDVAAFGKDDAIERADDAYDEAHFIDDDGNPEVREVIELLEGDR